MTRKLIIFIFIPAIFAVFLQESPIGAGSPVNGTFDAFVKIYDSAEGGRLIWSGRAEGLHLVNGYVHNIDDIVPGRSGWVVIEIDGRAAHDGRIEYRGLHRESSGGAVILETMDDELQIGQIGDELYVASDVTGFGNDAPDERVVVDGKLSLSEGTGATPTTGFGKVYVKSDDGHLYYMSDDSTETDLLETTATEGGGNFLAAFNTVHRHACVDQTIWLDVHLAGGSEPYTHLWSGDTSPLSATDIASPAFTATTAGIYHLNYQITDAEGATSYFIFNIEVHGLPTPSIAADPPSGGCVGEPVILSGDGCFSKYCWNPGGPCNKQFSVTDAGTYELQVVDEWGCRGTSTHSVTFLDPPVANAGSNSSVCNGGTDPTLGGSPAATGGVSPYTYSWTGSGQPYLSSSLSANPTFDATAASPGVYSLTLTVTDDNGCTDIDGPVVITIFDQPVAVADVVTSPVCPGDDIRLTGTATDGNPPYAYSWTGPDGFISTTQNPVISSADADNAGTYTLTVTDDNGCTSTSATVVVAVNEIPSVVSGPAAVAICEGLDGVFTITAGGTGPYTYQWERSTSGGSTWAPISGATSSSFTELAVTTGMDGNLYRCTVSGACEPDATSPTALLTVYNAPVITLHPSDTTEYIDETVTFECAATGTGTLVYQWYLSTDGGSSWSTIGSPGATYTTPTLIGSMDGYQYRCIVSGDCSPPDTSTAATLTVITSMPWVQTSQGDFEAGVVTAVNTSGSPGDVTLGTTNIVTGIGSVTHTYSAGTYGAVAFDDNYVYVGDDAEGPHILNKSDFSFVRTLGSFSPACMTSDGTYVYLSAHTDNNFKKIRISDGAVQWNIPCANWQQYNWLDRDDSNNIYVPFYGNSQYRKVSSGGSTLWTYTASASTRAMAASSDGNYVYGCGNDNTLRRLNPSTGTNMYSASVGGYGQLSVIDSGPYEGYVFCGLWSPGYWRLYSPTLSLEWSYTSSYPRAVYANENFLLGGDDSSLKLFSLSGTLIDQISCASIHDMRVDLDDAAVYTSPQSSGLHQRISLTVDTEYISPGTIASQVFDAGRSGAIWDELSWTESIPSGTDITFEVRSSDSPFAAGAGTPSWTSVGGTSPVTTGLPAGQYKQWRATLTSSGTNTPTLNDVTVMYH